MAWTIAHVLPERHRRPSDDADLEALALAITHCDLVTCDAFMGDVLRRMHVRAELYTGPTGRRRGPPRTAGGLRASGPVAMRRTARSLRSQQLSRGTPLAPRSRRLDRLAIDRRVSPARPRTRRVRLRRPRGRCPAAPAR